MKDTDLKAKIKNARERIIEFDALVGGPLKVALILKTGLEKEIARRTRKHLMLRAAELRKFLLSHGVEGPVCP